jgi:hypothetical protein
MIHPTVDGATRQSIEAININGANFIRLRDLTRLVSDVSVRWSQYAGIIHIDSHFSFAESERLHPAPDIRFNVGGGTILENYRQDTRLWFDISGNNNLRIHYNITPYDNRNRIIRQGTRNVSEWSDIREYLTAVDFPDGKYRITAAAVNTDNRGSLRVEIYRDFYVRAGLPEGGGTFRILSFPRNSTQQISPNFHANEFRCNLNGTRFRCGRHCDGENKIYISMVLVEVLEQIRYNLKADALNITSAFRCGDPGFHGGGTAVDFHVIRNGQRLPNATVYDEVRRILRGRNDVHFSRADNTTRRTTCNWLYYGTGDMANTIHVGVGPGPNRPTRNHPNDGPGGGATPVRVNE